MDGWTRRDGRFFSSSVCLLHIRPLYFSLVLFSPLLNTNSYRLSLLWSSFSADLLHSGRFSRFLISLYLCFLAPLSVSAPSLPLSSSRSFSLFHWLQACMVWSLRKSSPHPRLPPHLLLRGPPSIARVRCFPAESSVSTSQNTKLRSLSTSLRNRCSNSKSSHQRSLSMQTKMILVVLMMLSVPPPLLCWALCYLEWCMLTQDVSVA